MNNKPHLAVEANKQSIKHASAGNKAAWLALYAEDAHLADPVGVSPMDPTGRGHQGIVAIEQFWDTVIGPANIEMRVERHWTSGDYCCCAAQVARNHLGAGKYVDCDMLAVYEVNEQGIITSMRAHWDFDEFMARMAKAIA
ncbi:nuclear transport factor 2 family protein [Seongchinamella sediminis]|uniref:Nuclear transport factor 2 family protein n=1 Tax=Seongchinamella sediminis TaxID=2283635 RepID=A0A3L7DZY3_9GAMM|nr:nuclear transport factor 2 family protein [Seongchinamella sediminis]RLQ23157.1 nuclear transport factor 2 family protein [Seongchinamella sediminis]